MSPLGLAYAFSYLATDFAIIGLGITFLWLSVTG